MYVIIEMQYSNDGTVATLVNQYEDINNAEWKYHQILSAAAISNISIHSAIMLNNLGQLIKSQYYKHDAQEEEVPEV